MNNNIFISWLLIVLFLSTNLIAQSTTETKKINITGGIGIGTQLYKAYGINDRNIGSIWNLHGNATIHLDSKFSIPFAFTIGKHGSSTSLPTFKQLGISPTYKWAKFHIGWRSVKMSDFTLSHKTIYGLGVELNPGIFRFAAVKGRLNNAINYEESDAKINSHVFKRNVTAIKLGVGSKRSFVDFIYLKAIDDFNSVNSFRLDSIPDPAENVVLGINTQIRFNSKLSFYAEFASSLYTRDMRSTLSNESFPKLLTTNTEANLSSRANIAFKSGVEVLGSGWRTKFQYERISPEYNSMGSYYIRDDSERYTVSPSFRMLNNKLNFNGILGIQKNNLLNTKNQTTKNILVQGSANYQASQNFGVNFNFNSFNLKQEDGHIVLNDTIRIAQVNSNYSLSPYWVWVKDTSKVQILHISLNHQELNDKNPFTREFTDMSTWFLNTHFSQNTSSKGLSWNVGSNYNIIQLPNLLTQRYGLSLGLNKSTKNQLWNISSSTSFNFSRVAGNSDGFISGDCDCHAGVQPG